MTATVPALLRQASAQVAELLRANRADEAAAVLKRLRAEVEREVVRNLTAGGARSPVHPRRRPLPARASSEEPPR